jgi:hypothetical protein
MAVLGWIACRVRLANVHPNRAPSVNNIEPASTAQLSATSPTTLSRWPIRIGAWCRPAALATPGTAPLSRSWIDQRQRSSTTQTHTHGTAADRMTPSLA